MLMGGTIIKIRRRERRVSRRKYRFLLGHIFSSFLSSIRTVLCIHFFLTKWRMYPFVKSILFQNSFFIFKIHVQNRIREKQLKLSLTKTQRWNRWFLWSKAFWILMRCSWLQDNVTGQVIKVKATAELKLTPWGCARIRGCKQSSWHSNLLTFCSKNGLLVVCWENSEFE